MTERLRRGGIRPICPAVDVTNYVLLEFGQPLHGYDLNRLSGGITVRRGLDNERLELLTGDTIELDPEVLVIADESGAIGLAGIMGGSSTAVSARTSNVFLEGAFFSPDVLAGRARRFGLHTDASVRFERGVDPEHQARAIERATALLCDIAGGEPGTLVVAEDAAELPVRNAIALRRDRLEALLGVGVGDGDVTGMLCRLGMDVEPNGDGWHVTPPPFRFDINLEVDLIEEVARLYGYDRIPEVTGHFQAVLGSATEDSVPFARVRATLVARDYQECMTYSFVDAGMDRATAAGPGEPLVLSNPMSTELAVMRRVALARIAERNAT